MWIRGVLVLALLQACGASGRQAYRPVEIDVTSRSETFALAAQTMRAHKLRILEEDEGRGIVSTQWEAHGGKHYNLQVLISPVSAVVNVGCRIERSLEILSCGSEERYPTALAREAKSLTKALQ